MADPADSPTPDTGWSFARRPRWLMSHVFVLSLLGLFVAAGSWQLGRLDERRTTNRLVEARSAAEPVTVHDAVGGPNGDGVGEQAQRVGEALDYTVVDDDGRYLDGEIVRVANRSQGGLAGDWSVGLFETDDGVLILVNRGFIDRDAETPPPIDGAIAGWLRRSHIRDGVFGADDTGVGDRVPRLDVEAIGDRLDPAERERLAPVWLQLDGEPSGPLSPVPLPPIGEGNHLSYAVQWFTFLVMGAAVYGLVLRRRALRGSGPEEDTSDLAPGPISPSVRERGC